VCATRKQCIPLPKRRRFSELTAGAGFACGLQQDGVVDCWGEDSNGFFDKLRKADFAGFLPVQPAKPRTVCGLPRVGGVACVRASIEGAPRRKGLRTDVAVLGIRAPGLAPPEREALTKSLVGLKGALLKCVPPDARRRVAAVWPHMGGGYLEVTLSISDGRGRRSGKRFGWGGINAAPNGCIDAFLDTVALPASPPEYTATLLLSFGLR
jgi:hypothetical protein